MNLLLWFYKIYISKFERRREYPLSPKSIYSSIIFFFIHQSVPLSDIIALFIDFHASGVREGDNGDGEGDVQPDSGLILHSGNSFELEIMKMVASV